MIDRYVFGVGFVRFDVMVGCLDVFFVRWMIVSVFI